MIQLILNGLSDPAAITESHAFSSRLLVWYWGYAHSHTSNLNPPHPLSRTPSGEPMWDVCNHVSVLFTSLFQSDALTLCTPTCGRAHAPPWQSVHHQPVDGTHLAVVALGL